MATTDPTTSTTTGAPPPLPGTYWTNYNGQQTLGPSSTEISGIQSSADNYNKLTGQTLTAQQYDATVNPNDWQARWNADGTAKADTSGTGTGTGIVNGSASTGMTTTAGTPASSYTPWSVTPDQTVEGRIRSIINPNNPLIANARAGAIDQMNARGLSNSSLATSAADTAAYNAAIPIATADAATASKAAASNADIQNQMAMQGRQLATQQQIAQGNNQTALAQTTLSTEAQKSIATASNQTQTQINTDLNANRVLLQNSQAAVNLANQYALNVGNIDANNQMDPAAKQAAIQSQQDIFNQSIKAITATSPGIPDVSSTLVFNSTGTTGTTGGTSGATPVSSTFDTSSGTGIINGATQ